MDLVMDTARQFIKTAIFYHQIQSEPLENKSFGNKWKEFLKPPAPKRTVMDLFGHSSHRHSRVISSPASIITPQSNVSKFLETLQISGSDQDIVLVIYLFIV